MTDPSAVSDGELSPYASPSTNPNSMASSILRPTGVTVVSVLCIIGGMFGLLSVVMQMVGLIIGTAFAGAFAPAGPAGDAQRQWMTDFEAVNAKYLIPNVGLGTVSFAVSICFLIGGLALLKPKSWSGDWIRKVLLAAIVIEILGQIIYIVMQIDLLPILERQFDAMAPSGGGNPPPEMLKSFQMAAIFAGYAIAGFWAVTKLGMYVWGRHYLNRDPVRMYIRDASSQ